MRMNKNRDLCHHLCPAHTSVVSVISERTRHELSEAKVRSNCCLSVVVKMIDRSLVPSHHSFDSLSLASSPSLISTTLSHLFVGNYLINLTTFICKRRLVDLAPLLPFLLLLVFEEIRWDHNIIFIFCECDSFDRCISETMNR
jgi:hypothetical protein